MAEVLVDGSNVARCAAWLRQVGDAARDDATLRRRLVDATCSWAAAHGHDVHVAFDGAGPWRPGVVRITPQVEVIGSGAREGDDVLERLAADLRRRGVAHWLVTNDGALRQVAGIGADRVIRSDDFVLELAASPDPATNAAHDSASVTFEPPPGTALSEALDPEVRARLERIRRGDA
jgi:predicted RNA-binding protein with PIN domain